MNWAVWTICDLFKLHAWVFSFASLSESALCTPTLRSWQTWVSFLFSQESQGQAASALPQPLNRLPKELTPPILLPLSQVHIYSYNKKTTSGHYLFFLIGLGIIISKPDFILLGIKEEMNMEKSVMFVHVPQDYNMKSCRWRERYWSRDGKSVGS